MPNGITPAGFVRPPYDEILSAHRERIRANMPAGIDLTETQFDGQRAIIESKALDELWQLAEDSAYQVNLSTADGVFLDRVGELRGLKRNPAQKAAVTCTFSGTPSTVIAAGGLVATDSGVQFETVDTGTIGGGGSVNIVCRALDVGITGLVGSGTITIVVSSMPGVDTVTNSIGSSGGSDTETDSDFRNRIFEAEAVSGSSDYGITAALRQVAGVTSAVVYTNPTYVSSLNGVPPKSINAVVQGGVDEDIFQALYRNAPAGIGMSGAESLVIVDDGGEAHTVKFDRPTDLPIFVIVNLTVNAQWDPDQVAAVKTAVVKTIGGIDTVDLVATEYVGLAIGESVRTWTIIADLDEAGLVGIDAVQVLVGTVDPPTEDTLLSILARENPVTETANVEVNTAP